MPKLPGDTLALRVTPLVFAAVFLLGAWADPLGLLSPWADWASRGAMILAAATSAVSAAVPSERLRFAALAFGSWATLSRGLTLLVIGQDVLPRKTELIGGGVWMAASYLVLFTWLVTVPIADGQQNRG